MHSLPTIIALLASLALPASLLAQSAEAEIRSASAPETFDECFALVLPQVTEEAWRSVGWRTNLMEAREAAQQQQRPVFLWIMVGNPHGCT
jgi:hypothetical protein